MLNDDRQQADSTILFTMSRSGELYIDIDIEDYGDESIKNFAKLVSSLGTLQLQLEAAQIASSGIMESIPDQLELFISEITRRTTKRLERDEQLALQEAQELEEEDKDGKDNKPCIKPSDLL
jgi:hypothetical protein|tara:strand:- start:2821 stop:3186 length:366 start_codon:yes stop_codon:yes gene_type:complete